MNIVDAILLSTDGMRFHPEEARYSFSGSRTGYEHDSFPLFQRILVMWIQALLLIQAVIFLFMNSWYPFL